MAKILNDINISEIKSTQIVLAGGCFDVIHEGHIEFLRRAKELGKSLIILLESDENIRKIKGENRPLNNQIVRANNLSKLDSVDYIVMLAMPSSSDYYYNLVKNVHPDIIAVTAGDPKIKDKKTQAEMVGGKVVEVMKRNTSYSTTSILNKSKL